MGHGTIEKAFLLAPDSNKSWTRTFTVYFPQELPSNWTYSPSGYFDSSSNQQLTISDSNFSGFNSNEREISVNALEKIKLFSSIHYEAAIPEKGADIYFGGINANVYTNVYGGHDVVNGMTTVPVNLDSGVTVWITNNSRFDLKGEIAFQRTIMHEIGHALGLIDATKAGFGSPGDATNPENTKKFSIMAYNPHPGTREYVTDYQLYDIAALQKLYGRTVHEDGDNDYNKFDENGVVKGFSIWDSKGNDTIDASRYDVGSYIDLRPGYFSSIGPNSQVNISNGSVNNSGIENISIAFGAYVENARGGNQNDVLVGNVLSNNLEGGKGNDILFASGSAVAYAKRFKNVGAIDASIGDYHQIEKGGGLSIPTEMQEFVDDPTKQFDKLSGGEGDDYLYGAEGNDILSGDEGDDYLYGGDGNNILDGGDGDDTISYKTQNGSADEAMDIWLEMVDAGVVRDRPMVKSVIGGGMRAEGFDTGHICEPWKAQPFIGAQ